MTMTNDQAIAYLAEMDREINVLLQARRAGQQIDPLGRPDLYPAALGSDPASLNQNRRLFFL